jgi:hypothetical protein
MMPSIAAVDGPRTLYSCGCRTTTIADTFFLHACTDPNCQIRAYVIEASKRRGNVIQIVDVKPEAPGA